MGLYNGTPAYFVDDLTKLYHYMLEVKPTVFASLPRFFEKIHAKLLSEPGAVATGFPSQMVKDAFGGRMRLLVDGQLPFPLPYFRKRWSKITIAAKVNIKNGKRGANFTFHDLRKEFASNLVKNNVNPEIVRRLFAHSDMRITQIYMHPYISDLSEAINTLN